ncbi:hypothetical protein C8J57DRAFT_430722 [Mycena rebaudengoi]|nr:hypothetical protein C8J57DRAFT_430722 [Mycena rebaudengoi]
MASPQKSSPSPPSPTSSRSLSDRISAVGAKINRALSNEGRLQGGADTESMASTVFPGADRSASRGREALHSSGRGGIGNIHATSTERSSPPNGADEFPWPRGRERAPVFRNGQPVRSIGRGGSGNFSPSPSPGGALYFPDRDREIARARAGPDNHSPRSTGRGGMGNIINPVNDSRSRSRSIDPTLAMSTVHVRIPGYSASPDRRFPNAIDIKKKDNR